MFHYLVILITLLIYKKILYDKKFQAEYYFKFLANKCKQLKEHISTGDISASKNYFSEIDNTAEQMFLIFHYDIRFDVLFPVTKSLLACYMINKLPTFNGYNSFSINSLKND